MVAPSVSGVSSSLHGLSRWQGRKLDTCDTPAASKEGRTCFVQLRARVCFTNSVKKKNGKEKPEIHTFVLQGLDVQNVGDEC